MVPTLSPITTLDDRRLVAASIFSLRPTLAILGPNPIFDHAGEPPCAEPSRARTKVTMGGSHPSFLLLAGIMPPHIKGMFDMGLATTPPQSTHIMTPKVRVISPAPWGVGSSCFLLLRGHGPLLKGTIRVENGPRVLGTCIGRFWPFWRPKPTWRPQGSSKECERARTCRASLGIVLEGYAGRDTPPISGSD